MSHEVHWDNTCHAKDCVKELKVYTHDGMLGSLRVKDEIRLNKKGEYMQLFGDDFSIMWINIGDLDEGTKVLMEKIQYMKNKIDSINANDPIKSVIKAEMLKFMEEAGL